MLVDDGLNSTTFSGTITGYDYATGDEKIVTVNVDLTATRKLETSTFSDHLVTHDFTVVDNGNGQFRPASSLLNIRRHLTSIIDDAVRFVS